MRYETLMIELDKAKVRYEATIRQLITKAAQEDQTLAANMLDNLPGKKHATNGNGVHWTQTPRGKKILAKRSKDMARKRKEAR